jgi:hypothetical protein
VPRGKPSSAIVFNRELSRAMDTVLRELMGLKPKYRRKPTVKPRKPKPKQTALFVEAA